jgi:ParB family chromosome partitioning protein
MTKMKISNLLGSGKIPEADAKVVKRMPQLQASSRSGNYVVENDTQMSESVVEESRNMAQLEISMNQIDISPFQPRIVFDINDIQSLADSISLGTLIDPVTVRQKNNEQYELISGERRFRAHQLLGLENIPAVVKSLDDKQSALLSIASNTVREDLSDFELGMSFKKLLDNNHVKSVVEIARHIGMSRQQIDRCLDFTKLPESVIELLIANPKLFGANFAEFLASYLNKGYEDNILQSVKMVVDGATEQRAMIWLKNQCGMPVKRKASKKHVDLFFNEKHLGNAYIDRNKVIIQCNGESKPSEILNAIHNYFTDK